MNRDEHANDDVLEPEIVSSDAVAGFATPGAILTRMRIVDADVRAFDAEVRAHRAQLTTAFERGWAHWRDAWFRFYRENESFAQRAWPGTLDEVEAFARRLPDWRARAERAGLVLESPAPRRPAPARPLVNVELPELPDLPSLRDVAPALREIGPALREVLPTLPIPPVLAANGPLSSEFWANVKPVAIAGAVTAGALALAWMFMNLRMVAGQAKNAETLAPMLLTRGMVR